MAICEVDHPLVHTRGVKTRLVPLHVTMTSSHSKVTHQSKQNMPFEHHGAITTTSRADREHLCDHSTHIQLVVHRPD